jgi:hypothetical protein
MSGLQLSIGQRLPGLQLPCEQRLSSYSTVSAAEGLSGLQLSGAKCLPGVHILV